MNRLCAAVVAVVLLGWALNAPAQDASRSSDLAELSLEELMNVEVTSVSKKEEPLFGAPAAIYVITQEELRRSGATSVAEALRMVPGVLVARMDSNKWAVAVRGFNNQFANDLLVLIDGRTVYTPLFAGVFWDVQDMLLEDVERIEVVRGPGATLWGANAVNGVINIITKRAQDTPGGLLTGTAGDEERGIGGLRYGGSLGKTIAYRAFVKYVNRDSLRSPSGPDAADDWEVMRGGFRLDWQASARESFTLQGDLYDGDAGWRGALASLTPPFSQPIDDSQKLSGGDLLGRWSRTFSDGSNLALQLYYDRTSRALRTIREDRDTADVDLQHRLRWSPQQEIAWGLGYRMTADAVRGSFDVATVPDHRTLNLFSAFIQDEITLVAERLFFTLGSKFEHNDLSGFEVQPSGRLKWQPHHRHLFWGAVSRAVRMPSRGEDDIRINFVAPAPDGSPVVFAVSGNRAMDSEEVLSHELGYRWRASQWLSLDGAAFYNLYDGLLGVADRPASVESTPPPVHVVQPITFVNSIEAQTYGLELFAQAKPMEWWTVGMGYTLLDVYTHRRGPPPLITVAAFEDDQPHNQFHLRIWLDLPQQLEVDGALYYVDNLGRKQIPSYIRTDARLGWRPVPALEMSFVAQNLSDAEHAEFGAPLFTSGQAIEIERAVFGQVRWRF
ncbi:MAG: TonB-dependent receptor [Deltaproteobacteria bacterium]|nr:TonB-dependent receptor [Deltaproteobacteria bacterium]